MSFRSESMNSRKITYTQTCVSIRIYAWSQNSTKVPTFLGYDVISVFFLLCKSKVFLRIVAMTDSQNRIKNKMAIVLIALTLLADAKVRAF